MPGWHIAARRVGTAARVEARDEHEAIELFGTEPRGRTTPERKVPSCSRLPICVMALQRQPAMPPHFHAAGLCASAVRMDSRADFAI